MALPNLFIPGAAKSGTSSLHEYLSQHPDIYMSEVKEPHFFARAQFPKGLEAYQALFVPGAALAYRGESSTSYMIYPKVIERIKKYIENPKFIFILKNPVDRTLSHYWWLKGMGYENRSLREAVLFDQQNQMDPVKDLIENFSARYYYQMSCYAKWLQPFWETVGKDNIYICTSEGLRKNPLGVVNGISSFLNLRGLEQIRPVETNKTVVLRHPGLYYSLARWGWGNSFSRRLKFVLPERFLSMVSSIRRRFLDSLKNALANEAYTKDDEGTRAWLGELFAEEVRALHRMTGMSFSEWGKDFPLET